MLDDLASGKLRAPLKDPRVTKILTTAYGYTTNLNTRGVPEIVDCMYGFVNAHKTVDALKRRRTEQTYEVEVYASVDQCAFDLCTGVFEGPLYVDTWSSVDDVATTGLDMNEPIIIMEEI